MLSEYSKAKVEYIPPSKKDWVGRIDAEKNQRFHEIIKLHNVCENGVPDVKHPAIAMIGFASDEGVRRNSGRVGAALGPAAFRAALAPLPVHFSEEITLIDCGTVVCVQGNLEDAQEMLSDIVRCLRKKNIFSLLIGGGHEIAWAHYKGLSKGEAPHVSVCNVDAHFDLRPLEKNEGLLCGHSGTSFTQIAEQCREKSVPFSYMCLGIQKTANTKALFQKADRLDVHYCTAEDLYTNQQNVRKKIDHFIAASESIHCTICLDVFASAYAPGVSAPQPFGITPRDILPSLQMLFRSGKIAGLDIAELNPLFDQDERTAKLAAHLVATLLEAL